MGKTKQTKQPEIQKPKIPKIEKAKDSESTIRKINSLLFAANLLHTPNIPPLDNDKKSSRVVVKPKVKKYQQIASILSIINKCM